MGAAVGQQSCIATVLRNSRRYGNQDILEDGCGINLLPLARFAMEVYKDDPCSVFEMKGTSNYNAAEKDLGQKMRETAIAIMQFKLEGQLSSAVIRNSTWKTAVCSIGSIRKNARSQAS